MSGVKNSTGFGKEKIGVTHTESGFPQTQKTNVVTKGKGGGWIN